ncbi:MAG: endolytic transglycosylase MltG [Rikenellaceae bacterium]|nr:endolytic transglycosylase MltG [Rikenellaceae bacterium]
MLRKKRKTLTIILLAAVLGIGVWGGLTVYNYKIRKAVVQDGGLYIPTGGTFDGMIDSLMARGLISNEGRLRRFAAIRDLHDVRPGYYRLEKGMGYGELINRLLSGAQTPVRVTFNNVRTVDRLAGSVARYLEADSASFAAALTGDSLVRALGFTPQTFIAMFIPNTYELYWTTTPEAFAGRMRKEYDRFWNKHREERREELGLTRTEVMTLASIVYEETKKNDEMARVAGVYINRLRQGMPLQADPTVKFAVGDVTLRRILHKHLEVNSPYNTYKYAGLPPGPICMPSIRAIDAVLSPEAHDYLYFCARDDFSGYHNFARTLAEHNRNAQAYARALDSLRQ